MAMTSTRSAPRTAYEALADYERRSLAHAAATTEVGDTAGMWRGIGFRIGSRHLLSSIAEVGEILACPDFAVVPGTRAWLIGIANIRGGLVPIVDLRRFIEDTATDDRTGAYATSIHGENSRILLVRQHAGSVGLLVDEVLGQRGLTEGQRSEAHPENDPRYQRYVRETVRLGDIEWGMFNVATLLRAQEFQHAAL
ncbi:MAG: chemotaxis protein CheW [Dokdonella sp.]